MSGQRAAARRPRRRPRKGRQLERLVALLEQVLGPQAQVRSPDHIADRDTGELREVDVSVRMQVGSTAVLIIGECRDRKAVQDVTWIEQLAEKAVSVGAVRALAVSRAGFYAPALAKAQARGVEIRLLKELTAESVLEAVRLRGFRLYVGRTHLLAARVVVAAQRGSMDPDELMKELDAAMGSMTTASFTRRSDGAPCSVLNLWNSAVRAQRAQGVDLHEGVPEDGTRAQRHFAVRLLDESVEIRLPSGKVLPVVEVQVTAELWYELSEVEPSAAYAYSTPGETLVESVEYHVDLRPLGGAHEAIAIHHRPGDAELQVTRRQLGES